MGLCCSEKQTESFGMLTSWKKVSWLLLSVCISCFVLRKLQKTLTHACFVHAQDKPVDKNKMEIQFAAFKVVRTRQELASASIHPTLRTNHKRLVSVVTFL